MASMKPQPITKEVEVVELITNMEFDPFELELFDMTTDLMIQRGSYPNSGETTDEWLARIEAEEV